MNSFVSLPTSKEREEIIHIYADAHLVFTEDVSISELANRKIAQCGVKFRNRGLFWSGHQVPCAGDHSQFYRL